MKQKIIEVKDLSVSFNTPSGELQAIRKISFDLYKKEVLEPQNISGMIITYDGSNLTIKNTNLYVYVL